MHLRFDDDTRRRQYTMSRWGAHKLCPSRSMQDDVLDGPQPRCYNAGSCRQSVQDNDLCASLSVIRPSYGCRRPACSIPARGSAHSRYVAEAARNIATHLPPLDAEMAYALGLLHDIGRRAGVTGLRHSLDGYLFLAAEGCEDAGRVCLTHCFQSRDVRESFGAPDCTPEEMTFIDDYLAQVEYNDYDRLIHLCDSLANATGFCLLEKRMLDVGFRYGISGHSLRRWQATFDIKAAFERRMGCSVYSLLPGIVENTFGIALAEFRPSPAAP